MDCQGSHWWRATGQQMQETLAWAIPDPRGANLNPYSCQILHHIDLMRLGDFKGGQGVVRLASWYHCGDDVCEVVEIGDQSLALFLHRVHYVCLSDWLMPQLARPTNVKEELENSIQLLQAVSSFHRLRFTHNDIKPQNFVIATRHSHETGSC